MHRLALEVAALLQQLVQVPGNGLALAVRVGGEVQRVGLRQCFAIGLDVLFVALDDAVASSRTRARDPPRLPWAPGRARGHRRPAPRSLLPRYFLMVFALAGDSTITRFSAMPCMRRCAPPVEPRDGAQCVAPESESNTSVSMRAQACSWPGWLESTMSTTQRTCSSCEVFHVQRQQPVDDQFALRGLQDAHFFQRQQQAAASPRTGAPSRRCCRDAGAGERRAVRVALPAAAHVRARPRGPPASPARAPHWLRRNRRWPGPARGASRSGTSGASSNM